MDGQNSNDFNVKIIPPKEYLPKIFVGLAAILAVLLVVLIVSQVFSTLNTIKEGRYIGQSTQYKNSISVYGEGKVLAKPDVAQIDLTVLSEARTVSEAVNDNSQKMNKIIQALKDLGVSDQDLQTANYSIYPNYQYIAGRSDIIGYNVSQTLRVKVKNLDKTGQILEKATSLGANQAGSLSFTFDDQEKLKDEARLKAIANAKKKANELAVSLGVKIGKIVSFTESSSNGVTPIAYAAEGRGGGGGGTPDIQPGQNEIQVNVTLVYEIY